MKIHVVDLGFQQIGCAIAVFVVECPDGLVLIETGPASALDYLRSALRDKGWNLADFRHVFLSHIHFDHAGAAWAFAETGAKIYVHPKGLPHLASPEKLYQSARMIYKDRMDSLWGPMHPIPTSQLYAPSHGEVIEACGLRLTAWYTPGHAVHHVAWELSSAPGKGAEAPVLFTGDVAGVKIGDGPVAPPCPPPDINIEDWQESIRLMRKLPSDTLYLTHFGRIDQKQKHLDELEQRLLAWAAWMKPYAEQQTPSDVVVPLFESFVAAELAETAVDEAGRLKYETANPAFMSVAGLLRYWNKKITH
ncbi:MAG: MBL fold metallo-hydrolase [Lewinellaceae bacterium]|nr:MBL fold metallo-hydrolase [Lewinellaceae bacterium]